MEFCTELDNANNKLAPKAFTLAATTLASC